MRNGIGDDRHVGDNLTDCTVDGAARHRSADRRVRDETVQPRLHLGRPVGRDHAVDQRRFRDDEQWRTSEPLLGQHLPHVGGHFGHGLSWHPVEHDHHGGVAIDRRPKRRPRNRIGVSGGGGDEEPEVGRRHQHARHLAVGLGHRVQVGGVEQTQSGRNLIDGDQTQPEYVVGAAQSIRTRSSAAGDARQPGKDVVGGEPVGVGRVVCQHGVAGRRTQHPGGCHRPADQPVDQGGLSAAGRAADDGQQRCVGVTKPGQDVVVELVREVPGNGPCGVRTGNEQGYPHPPEGIAKCFQRRQQRSGHRFILP